MFQGLLWKGPLVAESELTAGMERAGEEAGLLGLEVNAESGQIVAGITMVVEEGSLNSLAHDFIFIIKKFEKGSEMSLVGHASKMASPGRSTKEKGKSSSWQWIRLSFRLSSSMKAPVMSDSSKKNDQDDRAIQSSGRTHGLLNKSLVTNLIALGCVFFGCFLNEPHREFVFNVGLFAFSGALTNWLAIHMLFEKVPGFYGSGVIPARFEDFKGGIHQLIMQQFFTHENVSRFFEGGQGASKGGVDLDSLIESMNLDPAFDALKEAVLESKFGATLSMFGGAAALDPMKPAFEGKMRIAIAGIASSPDFQEKLQSLLAGNAGDHSELLARVNVIVDKRLQELTPTMVKEIIQQMIRDHLGWLVVWGGVCGGLIGLLGAVFV